METMIRNRRWLSSILAALLIAGCAGSPPGDLGVRDGKLAACPASPNCVSSQAQQDTHRIAPLHYAGPETSPLKSLVALLESDSSASLIEVREGYVRAEFRTRIMGFVDDVEFWWQSPGRSIEVRSASRLGYADFGVNRARVEQLRKALKSSPERGAN